MLPGLKLNVVESYITMKIVLKKMLADHSLYVNYPPATKKNERPDSIASVGKNKIAPLTNVLQHR